MKLPDHARLQELFLAACDLPAQQQSALLDEHCSEDPDLRRELQLLLRTDARENGIFADDRITDGIHFHFDTVVDSELPKRIGRYDVKKILGEGGMGIVYLAQQQNPRRDVAVKVIRAGMVSPDLLKRFELEASVLGRLAHPGIANIYEAGVFVDGASGQDRPFLAMEYIEGQPLREFVQRSDPATGDRLQLFVQICEAVHHAHQRGVIHRDLKPGNVLIKENGKPCVLDFGVARATGLDPGMSTMQTRAGQLIGTLPYMSPEQVTGHALDVDTRSDVYSLGVIVYELLTGQLPYDIEEAEYLKSAKAISEVQPTPLTSIRREFRADLNTVVLKALEKEPDRRYQSAKELGDDIQRYLNDQPIVAIPTGLAGRIWKWCQRNTAVAALLSLLGLAIVLGFVGITRQTFNALHSKKLAEDSALGTERVLDLLVSSFRSPDPTIEGRDVKMVDVLMKAASDLEDDSTEDPLIKARLLNAIGESFQSLGIYDQGVRVHKSALQIRMRELGEEHPDTMSSIANLAALTYRTGDYDEALRLFTRSRDLRTRVLGEEHPDTLKSMNDLAVGYMTLEKWEEAIKLYEQTFRVMQRTLGATHLDTLKAMSNIGRFYVLQRDYDQALPIAEQAHLLSKQSLGEQHPTTINALYLLAKVYEAVRPLRESLALQLDVLAQNRDVLGEAHPNTLEVMVTAAGTWLKCDNEAEAIRLLETASAALSTNENHRTSLQCMIHLGSAYLLVNRPEDALVLFEEVNRRMSSMPGLSQDQKVLGSRRLAEALLRTGQQEKGVEMIEQVLQLQRASAGDDALATADALAQSAYAYLGAGMYAKAVPYLRESLDLLQANTKSDNWQRFAVQSALGAALAEQGNREEAETMLLEGGHRMLADSIEPPYPSPREVADAIRRIIRFYQLTEQPDQEDKWRQAVISLR